MVDIPSADGVLIIGKRLVLCRENFAGFQRITHEIGDQAAGREQVVQELT